MKIHQVAIQLYTLRDFCKTASDLAQTCSKVRDIGYPAVQLSGIGPIPEDEINQILSDHGLICCATHESGDTIRKDTQKVIDRLAKLNCKFTAYPYPAGVDFSDFSHIESLAADLDAAGAKMAEAGQVLTYHNHANEFFKVNGKTILDHIYDSTDAQNLQGEIDTYWVQYGGGCPVTWAEKLANRLPLIHLKDYAVDPTGKPFYTEIGNGTLDFPAILAAAEKSGCEWFIVEQDTCPGDPFDSIRTSFEFIQQNLVEA